MNTYKVTMKLNWLYTGNIFENRTVVKIVEAKTYREALGKASRELYEETGIRGDNEIVEKLEKRG